MEETIARIEAAERVDELHRILDVFIQDMGFAEYSFIDNSRFGASDPLIVNSIDETWERDYRTNNFLDADPCLPLARTQNTPFTWSDVALPKRNGPAPAQGLAGDGSGRRQRLRERPGDPLPLP